MKDGGVYNYKGAPTSCVSVSLTLLLSNIRCMLLHVGQCPSPRRHPKLSQQVGRPFEQLWLFRDLQEQNPLQHPLAARVRDGCLQAGTRKAVDELIQAARQCQLVGSARAVVSPTPS